MQNSVSIFASIGIRGGIALAAVLGLSVGKPILAQQQAPPRTAVPAAGAGEVRLLPVQGNVYMLAGTGGNITVQVGPEGVVLVDTGNGQLTDNVIAAIRTISDKAVRFVINTHAHADHVGGNLELATLREAAATRSATTADQQAPIIAHESVLKRLSMPAPGQPTLPFEAWPSLTFTDKKEAYVNGEAIEIFHRDKAHTDGDVIVFFRKSDVVATGDIFVTTTYPVVDLENGGGINGVLDGLNHVIDLAIPQNIQEGGTQVIPGHGRIAEESDVVEYRDMVTIIRDRILDAVKKGMTLDAVKAARLTRDYDGRYGGTPTSFWNTDKFVEAVYKDLSAQNPRPAPRRTSERQPGT